MHCLYSARVILLISSDFYRSMWVLSFVLVLWRFANVLSVAEAVLILFFQEQTVDDGSGKLEVWRVEDFKRVLQDPAL